MCCQQAARHTHQQTIYSYDIVFVAIKTSCVSPYLMFSLLRAFQLKGVREENESARKGWKMLGHARRESENKSIKEI